MNVSQFFLLLFKGSLLLDDSILSAVVQLFFSDCEFPGTLEMFFSAELKTLPALLKQGLLIYIRALQDLLGAWWREK